MADGVGVQVQGVGDQTIMGEPLGIVSLSEKIICGEYQTIYTTSISRHTLDSRYGLCVSFELIAGMQTEVNLSY